MKRFGEIDICSFEKKKIVTHILCNKCGTQLWKCPEGEAEPYDDWVGINHTWNKQSLWVGETHEFHLCQGCYKKYVDSFEIKIIPY